MLPASLSGSGTFFGALEPRRGPQTCSLVGERGLDLLQRRLGREHRRLGEVLLEHLDAEVVVGVGLADVDRLQRLLAVHHHRDDTQRVGAREAGVDQHRVGLARDENGVDVEAVGIGVVDLQRERGGGLRGGGTADDAEHDGRRRDETGELADSGHGNSGTVDRCPPLYSDDPCR